MPTSSFTRGAPRILRPALPDIPASKEDARRLIIVGAVIREALFLICADAILPADIGAIMSGLRLTFACGPYDRTQALRDGTLRPEGIDLIYLPLQPAEIFWRMLQYQEFDASEMSLSNYTTLVSQGDPPVHRHPGVPVARVPPRLFLHQHRQRHPRIPATSRASAAACRNTA